MKRKKVKAKRRKEKAAPAPEEITDASAAPNGDVSYSVSDLLARAEALMDEVELEAAQRFCLRALELEPGSARALELCGLLLLESGPDRAAEARFCFARAAELAPRPHHSVLLYLAQLSAGADAVAHIERALQLMQEQQEGAQQEGWRHKAASSRDVSNAHCAIGEIFMTDLCDEPDAEQRCAGALQAALAADPSNPEALHLRASLHLVKGEPGPARQLMAQAVPLWLPSLRAALDKGQEDPEGAEGSAEAPEGGADLSEASGLSFESRLKAAQTLVEVAMLEEAAEVLESCQVEDDEEPQVLYLSCVTHFRLWERAAASGEEVEDGEEVEEAAANARVFLMGGLEMVKGQQQPEMEAHLREMLEALGNAGKEEEGEEDELPESSGDEMEQS